MKPPIVAYQIYQNNSNGKIKECFSLQTNCNLFQSSKYLLHSILFVTGEKYYIQIC